MPIVIASPFPYFARMKFFRGLFFAMPISILMWIGLIYGGRWVLHHAPRVPEANATIPVEDANGNATKTTE